MAKKGCCLGLNTMSWVLIILVAAAGYYLLSEHQPHVIEFLPFLVILACPLMHLFMHKKQHLNPDQDNKDQSDKNCH